MVNAANTDAIRVRALLTVHRIYMELAEHGTLYDLMEAYRGLSRRNITTAAGAPITDYLSFFPMIIGQS